MTTLYLNVPKDKADAERKKSCEDTLRSAVGSGYAIPMGQRAQGKVTQLKRAGEATRSGMVRYDVYMKTSRRFPTALPRPILAAPGFWS